MSRMLEEIREQPAALERTFRSGLTAGAKLARALAVRRPRLIVLVARGTSDNAAQFGRYLLEIMTGIPVSLAAPSVMTLYQTPVDFSGAMVVAISQSGESTDTNLVLERAKAQGAVTVGITNEAGSTLAGLAEHVFLVKAGKERSVAATKTYTGQLLLLYMVAHALGARIRLDDLRALPEWAEAALSLEELIRERAERYRFMERAVVLSRGLNYANAREFALKMMETCYVVAEGFSSADFLHGPIAMAEASLPAFMFAPGGATWPGMENVLARLGQLQSETLLITDVANPGASAHERAIVIPARLGRKRGTTKWPGLEELYTPIPYIIPAQLFVSALAEVKGLNPDRPRTLSKVTLTL
jgi:glucosamine--fructose-6-phosphate aminotransferase (isomerizing)